MKTKKTMKVTYNRNHFYQWKEANVNDIFIWCVRRVLDSGDLYYIGNIPMNRGIHIEEIL